MFNNLVGALVSGGKGYIGGVNQAKEEQDVASRRAREEEEFTWLQEEQGSKRKLRPIVEETTKVNFDIAKRTQADKELLDGVFPFVMGGEFDHAADLMFSRDPTRFPKLQVKLDPSTNLYSVVSGDKLLGKNMQREQVQNMFFHALNPGKQDVPKLAGDGTGSGGDGKDSEYWAVALNTTKARMEDIKERRVATTEELNALLAQRSADKSYDPDKRTQKQKDEDAEIIRLKKTLMVLERESAIVSNQLTYLFARTGARDVDDPYFAGNLGLTINPVDPPVDTGGAVDKAVDDLGDNKRALPAPNVGDKAEISPAIMTYVNKLLKSGTLESVYNTAVGKRKSGTKLSKEEHAAFVYATITREQEKKEREAKSKEFQDMYKRMLRADAERKMGGKPKVALSWEERRDLARMPPVGYP